MSTIKDFIQRRSGTDKRLNDVVIEGGRREGENNNPYLSARRSWNDHMESMAASRNMWQIMAIFSLMITLAAVGGIIHIGSQSKFIPYVVQIDQLGEAIAVIRADISAPADPRVIHASVAAFINDLRMVTPDIALQRRAIFRAYAMLSSDDPATTKTNVWLNGTESSSPFKRAANETVNIEIVSVIPQSPETWQVIWRESVYDRQGHPKEPSFMMRALLTIYTIDSIANTTEEQIRNNPLGIYVRDYSWAKQI